MGVGTRRRRRRRRRQVDNMAAAPDSPCPVLLRMACEGRPAVSRGDVNEWWRTWGGRDSGDADEDVVRLRVVREGWMAEPGPEHVTLKVVSFHCRCDLMRSACGGGGGGGGEAPAGAGCRLDSGEGYLLPAREALLAARCPGGGSRL